MAGANFRRACDVCGDDTYPFKQMVPMGSGYVCPPDARGFTDDDLNSLPPRELKPPIQPRPADHVRVTADLELYQQAEGRIFNLLTADYGGGVAPYRYVDVTNGDGAIIGSGSVRAAAWTILYLHSVLTEDRRPNVWVARATAKVRTLADYLLTRQCGSPTQATSISDVIGPTEASHTEYGGFVEMETNPTTVLGTIYSEDLGACGLALLRAWQLLADARYRAGYRAALTCLRRMQSGGKLVSKYAASESTGVARYHSGMWAHKMEIRDPLGAGGLLGGSVAGMTYEGAATPIPLTPPGDVEDVLEGLLWFVPWSAVSGANVAMRIMGRFQCTTPGPSGVTYRVRFVSTPSFGPRSAPEGTVLGSFTVRSTQTRNEVITFAKPSVDGFFQFTIEAAGSIGVSVDSWAVTCEVL